MGHVVADAHNCTAPAESEALCYGRDQSALLAVTQYPEQS
jgi:hypothetical protein